MIGLVIISPLVLEKKEHLLAFMYIIILLFVLTVMLLFPDKKKLKRGSKGGRPKGGKLKGGDKQPVPDPDKQPEQSQKAKEVQLQMHP